jgi:hypothetical protein
VSTVRGRTGMKGRLVWKGLRYRYDAGVREAHAYDTVAFFLRMKVYVTCKNGDEQSLNSIETALRIQ